MDRPASSPVRSSPRITRSCAVIAASGPASRCGASSLHVCVEAATSVSGPRAKRPAPSTSTRAANDPGASSANRYSANSAAGQCCRPRRAMPCPGTEREQAVPVARELQRRSTSRSSSSSSGSPESDKRPRVPTSAAVDREATFANERASHAPTARRARRDRAARRARSGHLLRRSRPTSLSRCSGMSSPPNSQITVRSLNSAWKLRPLSMAQMRPPSVGHEQAVPALAVGVVGQEVEHAQPAQLVVPAFALVLVEREVVLLEVGLDEPLQRPGPSGAARATRSPGRCPSRAPRTAGTPPPRAGRAPTGSPTAGARRARACRRRASCDAVARTPRRGRWRSSSTACGP